MLELIKNFEKDQDSLLNPIQNIWEAEDRNLLSSYKAVIGVFNKYQSPFLTGLISEDNYRIPEELSTKINEIAKKLNFKDYILEDIKKIISKIYLYNSGSELSISETKDNEITIYNKTTEGTYRNVLFDEDGDIEILVIPTNRTKSYNKRIYKEDGINYSYVARLFNEM